MKKNVMLAMLLIAAVGCYRDPTGSSHVRQSVNSKDRRPETMVPKGGLPAGDARFPGAIIQSREVVIGQYSLTAPSDWLRRQPGSAFLLAEFSLFVPESSSDGGRLTVSTAGGTIEDNVNRWKGQFGGAPEKESQETLDINGVKITWVDYTGTFADQLGPTRSSPKSGFRMLGAIIPLDGQLFFVKAYGPENVVTAHLEKIRGFVQSLKSKPAAGEEPESGEQPAAGEKPESGEKPAAGEKSESGEKPAAGETPSAGEKPDAPAGDPK